MTDQSQTNQLTNQRKYDENGLQDNDTSTFAEKNDNSAFTEETAAEVAAPVWTNRDTRVDQNNRNITEDRGRERATGGTGIGFGALILSILSLFFIPILFGGAGIVLGFIARRRGAKSLGSWAIGIGAFSLIISMFIAPFF